MRKQPCYRPGQAVDEPAVNQSILAGDPGLAWGEAVQQFDPNYEVALNLFWLIDARFVLLDTIKTYAEFRQAREQAI